MRLLIKTIFFLLFSTAAYAAAPVIFYSDLTSGPNTGGQNNKGVFVTIWGNNFGSTQGSSTVAVGSGNVDNYPTWTNTMICFQLGASVTTGNIVVTTSGGSSNGLSFTVRSGNIYFVDVTQGTNGNGAYATPWNTLASAYSTMVAGDTIYLRAGTLTNGQYGYQGYSAIFAIGDGKNGSATDPYAFIGYPNETFTMSDTGVGGVNYIWRVGGNGGSSYVTIAKTTETNNGGAYGPFGQEGTGYRIIGNKITSVNTNYGIIDFSGTNVAVLGNEIFNSYCSSQNNETHSVYIDGPNSNFEVGWNYFHGNYNQGWEISNYHNGPRIGLIHDNLIIADHGAGAIKGILVDGGGDGGSGNPDTYSTMETNNVKAYNNVIVNAGQFENGGDMQVATGTNYIYNNTVYGSGTENEGMLQFTPISGTGPSGGSPTWYVADNILYGNVSPPGSAPYLSDSNGNAPASGNFSLCTNNNYYGEGNGPALDASPVNGNPELVNATYTTSGNWSIASNSPCIGAGYNTNSIVINDYNGVTRPNPPAIGAYEYNSCTANGGSCSSGVTCCSTLCQSSLCVSCITNTGSCSSNGQCCSNYCSSSTCVNAPSPTGNKNITGTFKINGMCNIQ